MLLPVDRNLILTGYTGPMQPLIGQQIADRLRLKYVNVDRVLEERAEMPVEELRARYGETRLKTLEAEIMQDVLLNRGAVIRVSGETLMHGDYAPRLQATGAIICLVVSLDAALQRLHLSLGARYHNPHQRALAVGQLKREWAVRRLPGVCELDVTYASEDEMVDLVIGLWQKVAVGVFSANGQ